MTTIRLGTASPATRSTTAATISHLGHIAQRAAAQKIDILLLPEAFIGGYPRGTSFGSKIGSRTAGGRDEYLEYFEGAVDLGDTVGESAAGGGDKWVNRELPGGEERGDGTREKLEKIAKDTGVFIVTGLVEKTGGTLYCAAVYVCPQKGMLGKRRKVMPVRDIIFSRNALRSCYELWLTVVDWHRTSVLGPSRSCVAQSCFDHNSGRQNQSRCCYLLGKLHAASPPGSVCAEHQPLPCAYSRCARYVVEFDENCRLRRPLLRRKQ